MPNVQRGGGLTIGLLSKMAFRILALHFDARYLLFQTGPNLLNIAKDSPSLVFNES